MALEKVAVERWLAAAPRRLRTRPRPGTPVAALLAVTLSATAVAALGAVPEDEARADLAVAVAAPATIAPGGGARYTLVVTNTGPDAAASVLLHQTLPAPLGFVAASDGGALVYPAEVRWYLGTMSPGQLTTVTMYASVPITATVGRVLSEAWVQSGTADPQQENNRSEVGSDVLPIDLRAEMATQAQEARPGEVLTHTVTVANAGKVAAEGVLVDVALAPGVTWVGDDAVSANNGFSRTVSAGGVRWYRPRLAGPSSYQVQLATRVAADQADGSFLTYAVTVTALTRDSDPLNNAAVSAPLPVRWPDLWLTKAGPKEIGVGGAAVYTLRYGNRGSGGAPGVRITDTLPAEFLVSDALPDADRTGSRSLSWDLGEIAAGDGGVLRVSGRLADTATLGVTVENRALATSLASDLIPADNAAVAAARVVAGAPSTVTVQAPASLRVGYDSGQVLVQVADEQGNPCVDGTAVLFDTTLGHLASPSLTTLSGRVTNTLESGTVAGLARVTAQAGSVQAETYLTVLPGPAASVAVSVDRTEADVGEPITVTAIVRDQYGNLAPNGTVVLFHGPGTVTPDAAFTHAGAVVAVWRSTSSGTAHIVAEVDGRSDQAEVRFRPGGPRAIDLAVTPDVLAVLDGEGVVEARVMDEYGNAVTDGVPVAFTAEGGSVVPDSGATVSGLVSATFHAGSGVGTARVSASTGDLRQSATVALQPADLSVFGQFDGPRGRGRDSRTYPGEPLTYTLAVHNRGLATARGVYVACGLPSALLVDRVRLPGGVEDTADPPAGLEPDIGQDYTDRSWKLPNLAAGDGITITLTGRVSRDGTWSAFQTLFARSAVTTTTPEATVVDLVEGDQAGIYTADYKVGVTLDYGASTVEPGGRLVYDITYGNGTAGSDGTVWITDTLPAYTSYEKWEPGVGSEARLLSGSSPGSTRLVWTMDGPKAQNGKIRLWLHLSADAPSQSVLLNAAEVRSSVYDMDLANNSANDGGVWLSGTDLAAAIDAPDTAAPGDALTYGLTVSNRAQRDAATNTTVLLQPPAGARVVSTTPPASVAGRRVTWSVEEFAAGGRMTLSATVEVPVTSTVGSVLSVQVDVASDQPESYPMDNRATATTRVVAGQPGSVHLDAASTSLTACTADGADLAATVYDRFGNPVADGTVVEWSSSLGVLSAAQSATVDGTASARLQAGRVAGQAVVSVVAGTVEDQATIDLVAAPPRALAVSADPIVVPRGGQTRIVVSVLDDCANEVADGWPIRLTTERGWLTGGGKDLQVRTQKAKVRATLHVGDQPGPLRVRATYADSMGEAQVGVTPTRVGLFLPFAAQRN